VRRLLELSQLTVQFSLRSFPNEPPKVQLAKGSNRMDVVGSAYLLIGFIDAVISLYLAWRYREFRKFLAGAFFVSCGTLFYLYVANVSVPLLGTDFVFTPAWSGARAILHFILFLLCVYFGWVKKPKASSNSNRFLP
jgi:hypothetical protein